MESLSYSPALMDLAWLTLRKARNDKSPKAVTSVFIVLVAALLKSSAGTDTSRMLIFFLRYEKC
jgi:hypothetical protein